MKGEIHIFIGESNMTIPLSNEGLDYVKVWLNQFYDTSSTTKTEGNKE